MNSYLSDEKLAYFKGKLLNLKVETEKLIDGPEHHSSPNEAIQELSDYGNHPADIGTEQFEQQRDAGLEQSHKKYLEEIDAALLRIEKNTFGISEKSGKPIPVERLEAMPTARLLVDEEIN